MQLSVVILNYNVRYFLELCLLSVQEAIQGLDAEIIVIDNNSVDDSCAMVKQRFPELTLLENKENVGFAKANNQAVAVAKGEYICILNPDTVVPEHIFTTLFSVKSGLPNFGFIGTKLIDGTAQFLPESKRNIPSPLTSFKRLFGIQLGKVKSYYADHLSEDQTGDVDVLVGAFMFSKRDTYLAVNGFDEAYFMYGEDIDLSYKAKKKGYLNYYTGDVAVIHYKGESTVRDSVYVERFYGAMRLFYKKHFKSNWFLDTVVSLGIKVLSWVQSFKSFDKEKRIVDQYFLVSKDQNLADRLSAVLGVKVELIALCSVEDLGDQNIEFIFDQAEMSFKDIIAAMQQFRNKNVTFKIRPKSCAYALGSNYSDSKGEVVRF